MHRLNIILIYLSLLGELFIISIQSNAQSFVELANLNTAFFLPTTSNNHNGVKVASIQPTAAIFLPLKLDSSNYLIIGTDYSKIIFDDKTNTTPSLTITTFQTGIIHKLNHKCTLIGVFIPKLSSDFKDISANHFQLGGAFLLNYKVSETLKLRFGLNYNREFFGNYFMPLAGISWKINDRYYLYGIIPSYMNLERIITTKFVAGIGYNAYKSTFRISNNGNYVLLGSKQWGENRFKTFLGYYITNNLYTFTEIGIDYLRDFQLYDINNNEIHSSAYFGKYNPTFFAQIGIAFRVHPEE